MLHQKFRIASAVAVIGFSLFSSVVAAHDYTLGNLHIVHPYTVPSSFAAQNGAAYIRKITNRGESSDQLVSASTPAAQTVELHTMKMDGDVMRMREISALPLPAKSEVTLRHDERGADGYHLMLMKLVKPLNIGDRFPLTLKFEKAGIVEVMVVVQARAKSDDAAAHKH
jgi:periplasmic copper chaperone A